MSTLFIGLDVHKATITACCCRRRPQWRSSFSRHHRKYGGKCGSDAEKRLGQDRTENCISVMKPVVVGMACTVRSLPLGHACTVAAPSMIPRKPGDHVKTDAA